MLLFFSYFSFFLTTLLQLGVAPPKIFLVIGHVYQVMQKPINSIDGHPDACLIVARHLQDALIHKISKEPTDHIGS